MRRFKSCPRCGAPLKKAISWAGVESEFWLECSECNTFINTYTPQKYQSHFHTDPHTFKGNFGGYGTGKTTTSRQEIYKHVLLTPNAAVLIGAEFSAQYEQTIKRELERDIPAAFVKDYSVQKAYMELQNGARIIYRPLADPDKLRSYNLTMFLIVEASETPVEAYAQLKTRLRNLAACKLKRDENGEIIYQIIDDAEVPIIEEDWLQGIVESNPDSGWIRSEVLYAADTIERAGTVLDEIVQDEDRKDPNTSAHVASTDVNKYLPPNFIEQNTKNKPGWWINRYILGSFNYAEGLVYPGFMKCIEPYFEIPKEWKRIVAFDYGLHDDAVYLFGAVDPYKGMLHIYKEVVANDMNIDTLARLYHDNVVDIPSGGLMTAPICDPKSLNKRDYEKKSLFDHFLEYGISFQPGMVQVDARVYRLNTYIESGKLKVMDNCAYLISEMREYKFKPKSLDNYTGKDKPIDKDNHAINPLEWIVCWLPANPKDIIWGAYGRNGEELKVTIRPQDGILPFALEDNPEEYDYDRNTGWNDSWI